MTNQEIKTTGQTIAQETQIGGNTAGRVGGVIEGIGVALDNKDAANGYYQATINGGSISVNAPNFVLGTGGNLRIKMPAAGTTASTLTIGNANAVQLWYNGAAVSAQNTWEQDEIISVFYDGTRFMASNSQGGGGKAEKIKYDNSLSGLAADNVQSAIDELDRKSIFKQDDSAADLNIGDNDGNVLLQMKDGEVATKKFNSKYAAVRKMDNSDADLNIGDESGNVVLQIKNGYVKTKNFDSSNIYLNDVGLLKDFTLPTIPAQNGTDPNEFFNLAQGNPEAQWVYDWYTPLIERSDGYITKDVLGKDSSGLYDIWRLTLQPKYAVSYNGQQAPVGTYPLKTSRKVVMVANIHGDPYDPIDAAFTLFWLCKFLVDDYTTNPVARYLRDNYTFIVIPIANPWGMDNRSYGTYNGVQINRNYPYHFVANQSTDYNTTTGPYPLSEKESQYISQTLVDNPDTYAYFDIHSFGKNAHFKAFYNPINDPFGFNKERVLGVFNNTASLIDGVALAMFDNCDFDGWGPGYVVHELGIWTPFLECNSFLYGVSGDDALQFSSGALTSNFYDLVGMLMWDR